jgi:hypothetical protein
MLDKARSLYETLKANWTVGSNKDQFQLALYLSIQNEYESGNAKEGLLAKVSAESNYDEKLTKANYVKVRVSELMSKRNEIASLMDLIQSNQEAINNIPSEVDETITERDRFAVEQYIKQEISVATKEITSRIETKESIGAAGLVMSALLFLITFISFKSKLIFAPYFTVVMVLLIIFSLYSLIGTKDLRANVENTTLEIQNKFSDEIKRSKAAQIAKMRVERTHKKLQEELSDLKNKQLGLQKELQKLIS